MNQSLSQVLSTVYLLVEKNEEILLIGRVDGSYVEGYFDLPNEQISIGESPALVASRRLAESIGLKVEPANLRHIHTVYTFRNEFEIYIFFSVNDWDGMVDISNLSGYDKLVWSNVDDLPPDTLPFIRWAITASRAGKTYSELGDDFRSF